MCISPTRISCRENVKAARRILVRLCSTLFPLPHPCWGPVTGPARTVTGTLPPPYSPAEIPGPYQLVTARKSLSECTGTVSGAAQISSFATNWLQRVKSINTGQKNFDFRSWLIISDISSIKRQTLVNQGDILLYFKRILSGTLLMVQQSLQASKLSLKLHLSGRWGSNKKSEK